MGLCILVYSVWYSISVVVLCILVYSECGIAIFVVVLYHSLFYVSLTIITQHDVSHSNPHLHILHPQHERTAVHRVAHAMRNSLCKSVKFKERPTVDELCKQLDLVTNCFDYLCSYDGDLDLMLASSLG